MLQIILLVVMILVSIALAAVVLLQRSEGGALGMGGGPSGFMTARGAGNLLTKTTWVLAAMFFICALSLTILGNVERSNQSIVDADAIGDLATPPPSGQQQAPADQPAAPAQPAAPSLQDLESSLTSAPAPAPAQPAPAQ
ncbi:preprotein translocase subunit SecG [Brevundimonas sp. M20]|uniref:preprotein translocase subunit SecG n=1 Tax=Brevundimonas sp. M20 TaxID=2591463 RepID=UPI0011474E2F|nr:preprotein translocase subunit SecG [Brevundimonas sp. M20]QDH73218.1 preprotein translocase subunit SecG [Brevundimonas sp. M20]